MQTRFFEIMYTNHRVLNPITEDQLMRLGAVSRLQPGMRQLDLACGKGEMLTRWAQAYGIIGLGVDANPTFLAAAHARAEALGVSDKVTFVEADASTYAADAGAFDVVSCIGASWIAGGMVGTINLMRPALKPGGLLLMGEVFWKEEPPDEVYDALGYRRDDFCTLPHTLSRFKAAGVELVEMVLATQDSFDQYESMQWMAFSDFLRANPHDEDAAAMRKWYDKNRQMYLEYGRRYMGWGVFVLRVAEGS